MNDKTKTSKGAADSLTIARAIYEKAREAFIAPANKGDPKYRARLDTAISIYQAKFKVLVACSPHADAIRWYLKVMLDLSLHLLTCGQQNVHLYSQEASANTWRLMRSWERMEAEIASLGYRTVSLEDMLKGSCDTSSQAYVPLHHLLMVKREDGEAPVFHSFIWKPSEHTSFDHSKQLMDLITSTGKASLEV